MYVFNYDPQTGRFTGGSPAEFDQLEPGKLLAPAFASLTPIPRFDAVNEWPFYVPDPGGDTTAGSWELRALPKEDTGQPDSGGDPIEPTAPVDPPGKADSIVEAIRLHLAAAERLRAELAAMRADDAGSRPADRGRLVPGARA